MTGKAESDVLKRWLWRDALPLWWSKGADHENGGFHEGLGLDGKPRRVARRLRVQARQTWVYACAHQRDPTGPWGAAARHGLEYLTLRFRRPDGLYDPLVDPDGARRDDPVLAYDQAFVLLALSGLHAAFPHDPEPRDAAGLLLRAFEERFRHDRGGFREASAETPFYANPQMHLLEAMLAWEETDPDGRWSGVADEVVELALRKFIDPESGALREHFDADWNPIPGERGRMVEPGHQFEWSWLLRRWGAARNRGDAIAAADRMFWIGANSGVDPKRGVAFNSMSDDLTPLDRAARLWPQTEWLKAAAFAARDGRAPEDHARLEVQIDRAAKGLGLYLRTAIPGLWRDVMAPDGRFNDDFAPGSSFYHIAGAIFALEPGV